MKRTRSDTRARDKQIVLMTCRNRREAERIARTLIVKQLAACVNLLTGPVQSIYRWRGSIETTRETLLLIKTSGRKFGRLEQCIREMHSYDVPEILALPVLAGSADYLNWLDEALQPVSKKAERNR